MTKILLVEDNEINRNMLSYRLNRKSYEVIIAVDGAEALSLATTEHPDLILMDLSLPIMNGWDATRKIKANPETQHIPVIALTAHAMSGDRQKALEAGCDDYDSKPIEFPRLLGKMKAQLGRLAASKSEEAIPKIDSAQDKTKANSIIVESSTQEQTKATSANVVKSSQAFNLKADTQEKITLLTPEKETKLLELQPAIKLVYAPIDTALWRTGSLVKVSSTRAEIISNKKIRISLQNKIQIRLFIENSIELGDKIYATVSEVFEKNDQRLVVKFTDQCAEISALLDKLKHRPI